MFVCPLLRVRVCRVLYGVLLFKCGYILYMLLVFILSLMLIVFAIVYSYSRQIFLLVNIYTLGKYVSIRSLSAGISVGVADLALFNA